jgi:regulatory protein
MSSTNHPKTKARQAALRRLDRRECSTGDISQALKRNGFTTEIIAETVQELVDQKLIDDQKYSRILVREQTLRGKGPNWIRMKLKTKGISAERKEVEALIEHAANTSELAVAQSVISKRYPLASSDPAIARKAIQTLLRRGFSYDVARQAIFNPPADSSSD